ncbi:MAG TPA: GAF domain-containing protein [Nocardioidaceae bacterium]|nr:GAF domain-containing protein [Nocardioidaceae bacterium]
MATGPQGADNFGSSAASESIPQALSDAVVGLGSDLDLRGVLHRIVQAACALSSARYGALTILGSDKTFVDLIIEGLSEDEIARIGEIPHGHGLLGQLLDDPKPLRIARISEHPSAHGFPVNHPDMSSFLGVPVHVHKRMFGLLYLADKQSAEEFSEADERAVAALGAAAGVAIENARLYALSQRRGRWLEASAELTRLLLERADSDTALGVVARRARELSGSAAACVLLADNETDLAVHAVDGAVVEHLHGQTVPREGPAIARVLDEGLPTTVPDLRSLFDQADGPLDDQAPGDDAPIDRKERPALLVPFRSSTNATGILLVVAPTPAPSREDEYMLQTFADQAAIALDLAKARSDGEMLVVLAERDRIARDLHDVVIQRMFATGLMLQGAYRFAISPEVRERVEMAVNELDTTIRDLRTAIFELHQRTAKSLRSELSELVAEYANVLGFAPRLSIKGPLHMTIDAQLRSQVLAVLREALSNVAKHAHATSVHLTLIATDHELIAQIADNGVGINEAAYESGLRNLRDRASKLGGSVTIEPAEPRGTKIEWRVPLDAPTS